jgi:N utilization substance protein A
VTVVDQAARSARVVVPDYQLSLAIGKEGQNARLAARLTGWRVDIKSETQLAEEQAQYESVDWAEGEWVLDEATGEQVWKPAEGGPSVSADQWNEASVDGATAEDGSAEANAIAEGGSAEANETAEGGSAEAKAIAEGGSAEANVIAEDGSAEAEALADGAAAEATEMAEATATPGPIGVDDTGAPAATEGGDA